MKLARREDDVAGGAGFGEPELAPGDADSGRAGKAMDGVGPESEGDGLWTRLGSEPGEELAEEGSHDMGNVDSLYRWVQPMRPIQSIGNTDWRSGGWT